MKPKLGSAVALPLLFFGLGCLPTATKKQPLYTFQEAGQILTVQVLQENIRQSPNGKILGRLRKGDPIRAIRRVGNWIEFTTAQFPRAYIWAPSVGFDYLNLYSPYFYIDSLTQRFKPVEYFQAIFSQPGDTLQETAKDYELFFSNLGLGSHTAVVMEVVMTSREVVHHGITLVIHKETHRIERVKIDFFRPVKGYQAALTKCGLPSVPPEEENSGHLIWPAGKLLPHHSVDLERKEWDSNWFSTIWYIQASP